MNNYKYGKIKKINTINKAIVQNVNVSTLNYLTEKQK